MSSLLRSTKFVRYFSGAARTLILSTAKTAEVSLLTNSKALCAVNSFSLRDYTTTKKNESLEPLLQKLDAEVKRYGRITKRDIDEVFDEIRAKNDITSSQSLLVIRCCGELVPEELPEQRTLLVQKIWNVLNERGVPMDVSHYNALLRVYLENEHPFSPATFLENMERKGLQPNRVTYQRLMWRYCQEGDVEGATRVLEKMREVNLPVSEPVLNALVMGHAFHGDTEGAKAVLETMAAAGLAPTNRTYSLLACGYAKQGDIANVQNVIATANEKEIFLTDRDILDLVEQLAVSGHEDKVDQVIPHLNKTTGYNQEVCNLILKLLNKNLDSTAKKIMTTMPKSSAFEDTKFKGAFYIKHLLKLNRPPESVLQSCRELESEGLIPSAIYLATEASLQQGQTELALQLIEELKNNGQEIRQHFYWPLLAQKGKEGDEEGLLQIVRIMANERLAPAGEALRDYVIPFLIEKDTPQNVIVKLQLANMSTIHSARNVMIELLDKGNIKAAAEIALQYCPRSQFNLIFYPLINALNKTKDIDSFITILHVTSSSPPISEEDVSNDDVQVDDKFKENEVGRIVKVAIKNVARYNLSEQLLTSLLSKGIKISTASAEEIEQFLGNNMTTEISEILAQLTSPDLEMAPIASVRRIKGPTSTAQLERTLELLENKEGVSLSRVQKSLLTAYINEKNFEKLNNFIPKLNSSKFEISNIMLAQIFEIYCDNDNIDKANEVLSLIKSKNPDFKLNRFKKIQMAYALIRNDRYDEAVTFIKENKPQEDGDPTFLMNSKTWQLLNTLAEQKEEAKVKEMTNLLLENSYVEPTNVILGPLIKVYMLQEDLDGALKEFEYCCKQYRSTPWKGELMKTLIMKEDATKLQWLADLSTQIHGEVNILHDLVLAFVECGRLRQARRILETPGLQTRHKRLQEACRRYVDEGKAEHLEGLLEATKELSHIDRSNIFYHLLVTYCKANETDKALGLWTVLQEEGEIPTEQFLIQLGNHLKAKNRIVPFVMPTQEVPEEKKNAPKPKAIAIKDNNNPSKVDSTAHIEKLVQEGKTGLAMDYTIKVFSEGVIPKSSVLKFLLKTLAEEGSLDKILLLGNYISENMRRQVAYNDKLTLAIFKRGEGPQHIDKILSLVENANSKENVNLALTQFPRSAALETVVQNEELLAKCRKIVDVAASQGLTLPANLLWLELVLVGKDNEANEIWQKYLRETEIIVFRRLLQESHQRKAPELIEKLIESLKSNSKLSLACVGNAYSRLINLHLIMDNVDKAKETLDKALESGVSNEHLNKSSLNRLNSSL